MTTTTTEQLVHLIGHKVCAYIKHPRQSYTYMSRGTIGYLGSIHLYYITDSISRIKSYFTEDDVKEINDKAYYWELKIEQDFDNL